MTNQNNGHDTPLVGLPGAYGPSHIPPPLPPALYDLIKKYGSARSEAGFILQEIHRWLYKETELGHVRKEAILELTKSYGSVEEITGHSGCGTGSWEPMRDKLQKIFDILESD